MNVAVEIMQPLVRLHHLMKAVSASDTHQPVEETQVIISAKFRVRL